MTQAAKSQEPSMEEILASIRRIIADDDASKSAPAKPALAAAAPAPAAHPAPPPPREPAPPEPSPMDAAPAAEPEPAAEMPIEDQPADILDLTESMAMPEPAPQSGTIDGSFDVSYQEPAEKPTTSEPPAFVSEERGRLMSNVARAAVDSAFNTLAQTVLVQNARTLEDMVREMLRPMLKGWLDDNLPGMVERMVLNEIERVSRGRMG